MLLLSTNILKAFYFNLLLPMDLQEKIDNTTIIHESSINLESLIEQTCHSSLWEEINTYLFSTKVYTVL